MEPEFEVSRQAPIFFLSYAHSRFGKGSGGGARNANADGLRLRLFNDLSMHVSEMVPHDTGSDPGFMDGSMGGGERWNQELLTATGTCQVFIALVSQPYVNSEWCAMEWDAFTRRPIKRKVPSAPVNGTTVLPVTWVPSAGPMPRAVSDVQRFSPKDLPDSDIAERYKREGLYGLLRLKDDDAYEAIAWRLAQRIVELVGMFYVEPQIPNNSHELRNVFRDGGDGDGR